MLGALGQRKIIFLAEQAQRYTAADIRALSEQRRALILLAFVIRKQQLGRDMLLEQMDKILRRLTRTSAQQEEQAVLRREKTTRFSRSLSTQILKIIATAPVGQVEQQLFAYMPQEEYRRIYEAVAGENDQFAHQSYQASILRRFEHHYRKILPLILTHIPFQAQHGAGKEIVEVLALLKQHLTRRTQQFSLDARPSFFDPLWDDVTILGHARDGDQLMVARRPLELQTLLALQGALQAGTVWVDGSERYAQLASTLVPWDEPTRVRLSAEHQFPLTAQEFTAKIITLMQEALADLEGAVKRGGAVAIQRNLWSVPKITEAPLPKQLRKLEQQLLASLGYPKMGFNPERPEKLQRTHVRLFCS